MGKAQIAVVDPSGNASQAISALLRSRRWSSSKVDLEHVAELPLDLDVVIAVENADGEGTGALREVRLSGSDAARILVCDARAGAQAVARGEPAHQVVVRPAPADKVMAAVKRALRVGELLRDPGVRAVASSFGSVPAMPGTWLQLNALLASETSTMQDAAALVERDIGLASKVLQLVNSGLFGLERPVSSLFAALQRLGLSMVRDLVLSVELFDDLDTAAYPEAFGPLPLARSSHLIAMSARLVAPRAAADAAFSAGLFSQLGRMIYATQAKVLFERAIERHRAGIELSRAESDVFGVHARVLAAYLLASWGLPHGVVEAVRWCEQPDRASGRGAPLALSVYLGSRLVEEASREQATGQPTTLVAHSELAPWGLSASLESWRSEVRGLLRRSSGAVEPV